MQGYKSECALPPLLLKCSPLPPPPNISTPEYTIPSNMICPLFRPRVTSCQQPNKELHSCCCSHMHDDSIQAYARQQKWMIFPLALLSKWDPSTPYPHISTPTFQIGAPTSYPHISTPTFKMGPLPPTLMSSPLLSKWGSYLLPSYLHP